MRLIDADALKEWVETEEESKWGLSTDEVRDAIEAAPTIEPKRGKWEKISDRNYKCSCCNAWWSVDGDSTMNDFNYCPNCGARMERSEE